MAHMNGLTWTWIQMAGLLGLNAICYISIGSFFGTLLSKVPVAMICCSIYAHLALLCAGFFTTTPKHLEWAKGFAVSRYTFTGLMRLAFKWTDSYKCLVGDIRIGGAD